MDLGATAQMGLGSERLRDGVGPRGAGLPPRPLPGHFAMRPALLLGPKEVPGNASAHLLVRTDLGETL